MKLTESVLIEIVKERILPDENFQEALEIIKRSSSGKIWLIGGFLYKNLVEGLYGTCNRPAKDFDLIVERANEKIILPSGWKSETNTFGNPRLFNGKNKIDFIPLDTIYFIVKNNLTPSIENFLNGVPLNIHCLAYEVFNEKITGEVGIKALEERVVRAYNLEMLKCDSERYGKSVNAMIKEKADALGFKAELI